MHGSLQQEGGVVTGWGVEAQLAAEEEKNEKRGANEIGE